MGWQTDALIHVSFPRETFDSLDSVKEFKENRKREIETARKTIQQLSIMTEPKKFCPEDVDPACWIQEQVDMALEIIEVNSYWVGLAGHVIRAWDDMHHENGLAYHLDEDSFDCMQRINGDYVTTCNGDGKEIEEI